MKRKIISAITALAMVLTILPAPMMASENTTPTEPSAPTHDGGEMVTVGTFDGKDVPVFVPATAEKPASSHAAITKVEDTTVTWEDSWYIVNGAQTINDIITVNGDVNLILADGAALNAPKGIQLTKGSTLRVWAQSTDAQMGTLAAGSDTPETKAGIDAREANLTLNGGNLSITGGPSEASIYEENSLITINGGLVDLKGTDAAGIYGTNSTLNMNAGTLKATGTKAKFTATKNHPGIHVEYNTINITGGTISATGAGSASCGIDAMNSSIHISGGTVQAQGDKYGINGKDIAISGGAVQATGIKGNDITISNGTVDTQDDEYGIVGNTMTISGGMVHAQGDDYGIQMGHTISTTQNGHAVLFVSSIMQGWNDETPITHENLLQQIPDASGVLFIGEEGQVYGNPTITTDATIPAGNALTNDNTLTIGDGVALTNEGTLTNNGTIYLNGTGKIMGTVTGNQPLPAAIEPAPDGSTTTTVTHPDGSTTTTEQRADGTKVVIQTTAAGSG